jgi:hypothetical protein
MSPQYRIVFTDLAKALATRNGSLTALEERVRGEIAEMVEDGLESFEDLMFHTIEMPDGQEYICSPAQEQGETILRVDTCTREEIAQSGDEGKPISLPVPDSD